MGNERRTKIGPTPLPPMTYDQGYEVGKADGFQRGLEAAARYIQKRAGSIHQSYAMAERGELKTDERGRPKGVPPLNEAARLDSYAHHIRNLGESDG